jgi:hypothetical protein
MENDWDFIFGVLPQSKYQIDFAFKKESLIRDKREKEKRVNEREI